jgi:hypothetical protein
VRLRPLLVLALRRQRKEPSMTATSQESRLREYQLDAAGVERLRGELKEAVVKLWPDQDERYMAVNTLCNMALKSLTHSESGALPPGVASMIANQQEPDADLRRAAAIAADRSGDKKDELDTPLCDGHADAWFTGRNHLPGDTRCVVCAFTPSHVAPVGDWAIGQNVRGLLERIKLHFQRGDPHDARYSTLSAEDKAAAFVADAERASREGDLLYFEICTLLQRQSIAPSASERGRDDALVERIWELLWEHCRVVFYPQNNEYPIEHAPHARKEARLAIIAALTKLAVVPPESTVTRNAADSRVKP